MVGIRFAFVSSLAVAEWVAALPVGRPGVPMSGRRSAVIAPFPTIWVLAAIELARVDAAQRAALMLGQT